MTPARKASNRKPDPDRARHAGVAFLLVFLPLIESCANPINLKRMTYEALRQADCLENQLDAFCHRTFANEYVQYEQLRQNYLRDTTDSPWRARREAEHQ